MLNSIYIYYFRSLVYNIINKISIPFLFCLTFLFSYTLLFCSNFKILIEQINIFLVFESPLFFFYFFPLFVFYTKGFLYFLTQKKGCIRALQEIQPFFLSTEAFLLLLTTFYCKHHWAFANHLLVTSKCFLL